MVIDCSCKSLEYLQLYISYYRLQTNIVALGHIWGKYQLLHNQKIDLPNNYIFDGLGCDYCFAGRTDNLFFCNVNIYRSTGTTLETLKEHTPLIELGAGQAALGERVEKTVWRRCIYQRSTTTDRRNRTFRGEKCRVWRRKRASEERVCGVDIVPLLPPVDPDSPLGINSLKLYRGKTLIYVGEGRRGSNCSEEFLTCWRASFV